MIRQAPEIHRAFPRLAPRLPWLPLASLPTPVEAAPDLGRAIGVPGLFLKRDDLTSPVYGGNKVRQIEWSFARVRAEGGTSVVTSGAWGSNWVVAAAIFGRALGLPVHAALYPQPPGEHVRRNLLAALGAGARIDLCRSQVDTVRSVLRIRRERRRAGERAALVLPGGASFGRIAGVLGYLDAGIELGRQVRAGLLPPPDFIHLPAGTLGTLGGLALGLLAGGMERTRLIGHRVVPASVANLVALRMNLLRVARHLCAESGGTFPAGPRLGRVHILHDSYGRGYGWPLPEGGPLIERFAERGIRIEPVYTAKAAAGMVAFVRREGLAGRRHLFWLTATARVPEPTPAAEEALSRLGWPPPFP